MFLATYKNTFKTLFRSTTFWLILIVLVITIAQGQIKGHYDGDSDEGFVLGHQDYVQTLANTTAADFLMYAFPIYAVFTVVLVLNRDYGDKFFEIEKAAGLKPSAYLYGRLAAIVTVNAVTLVVLNILAAYLYVFTRGGVQGMETGEIIIDVIVRTVRNDIFVAMPTVLFYIGITYFIGSMFKHGIPAAIGSIGYVIAYYVFSLMFRFRITPTYFHYFSPIPYNLRRYFHYYDTEYWESMVKNYDLTIGKVAICIGFLVGVSALCSFLSYLRLRKRNS